MLGLDPTAREYLLGLAAARPGTARRPRREVVPAGIRQLLDVIGLPAFVESRIFDVLAANRLATALLPAIRPGENRMRSVFLDEGERAALPDWDKAIGGMVAAFRASLGTDTSDPRIAQLVGELSLASEPFRRLWARHDVKPLPASPPGSCTRRSGCWSCAGRSCPSATRAASCWCCITPSRARTARGRWRCSVRWPPPAPAEDRSRRAGAPGHARPRAESRPVKPGNTRTGRRCAGGSLGGLRERDSQRHLARA